MTDILAILQSLAALDSTQQQGAGSREQEQGGGEQCIKECNGHVFLIHCSFLDFVRAEIYGRHPNGCTAQCIASNECFPP